MASSAKAARAKEGDSGSGVVPVELQPKVSKAAGAPRLLRLVTHAVRSQFEGHPLKQVPNPVSPTLWPVAQLTVNGGTGRYEYRNRLVHLRFGISDGRACAVLHRPEDQENRAGSQHYGDSRPDTKWPGGVITDPNIAKVVCSKRWLTHQDFSTDYAAIVLKKDAGVGWLGLKIASNQDLVAGSVQCGRVRAKTTARAKLWIDDGTLDPATTRAQLFSDKISTYLGQSGSPFTP